MVKVLECKANPKEIELKEGKGGNRHGQVMCLASLLSFSPEQLWTLFNISRGLGFTLMGE